MKKFLIKLVKKFSGFPLKHKFYIILLVSMTAYYIIDSNTFLSSSWKKKENLAINSINSELSNIQTSIPNDTIREMKRDLLLNQINDKLIKYLFSASDFEDLNILKKYFHYVPKLLNDIPSIVPLESGNYNLSSGYGYRFHPIKKKTKHHSGIDLAANLNQKVFSTANGVVVSIKHDKNGYGKHIIIKHRYGFKTLYGHLNTILVNKNQRVNQYTLIGTVGSTGASTGNHLHYETIKNGAKINPFKSFNFKKQTLLNP